MRPRLATLDEAEASLRAGGLACFPTETLWSLSCLARDAAAVRQVFAVKRRPEGVPLAVGFTSWAEARGAVEATPGGEALAARFLPGPVSLVLRRRDPALAHVAPSAATLAVRVPDHPAAQELLRRLGPLVMTSANRHGERDSRTDTEVLAGLDDAEPKGDLPVVRGAVPGVPSTLVDATGPRPRIIREGVIPGATVASAWP